jgi:hypothetical protein
LLSPLLLDSTSAAPVTVVQVDSGPLQPIALDDSTLTYWVAGDNCATNPSTAGSLGSRGVPSDGNLPKARQAFVSWVGTDSHLYLFGECRTALPDLPLFTCCLVPALMWVRSGLFCVCAGGSGSTGNLADLWRYLGGEMR